MFNHESQWLLRSALITEGLVPLTALVIMVREITEFHPYCISDIPHFYVLSFCLVFSPLMLPMYSSPAEYQIN